MIENEQPQPGPEQLKPFQPEQYEARKVIENVAEFEPQTEAERAAEIEQARQAVMEHYVAPEPEAPEEVEDIIDEVSNMEITEQHDKTLRKEITSRRVLDATKGIGAAGGSLALIGAGAAIGGAAIGVGLAAGTAALAVGLKKLAYNVTGFKAPHTHSWVVGRGHTIEQGVTESLAAARKVPKRQLPIAVLGETFNLVQNLPSAHHGQKVEYQMHTHEAIVKNFQRLEQAGLAEITSDENMRRFGKPRTSRLVVEKLTIGGAKLTDIFKPSSYRAGGVFDKVPIRTVKFNVSPREMTLEDIKNNRNLRSLAALPEGFLDVKDAA